MVSVTTYSSYFISYWQPLLPPKKAIKLRNLIENSHVGICDFNKLQLLSLKFGLELIGSKAAFINSVTM